MAKLKLWLISQNTNNNYDTYSAAVVAAENELEASRVHPGIYDYSIKHDEWGFKAGTGMKGRERIAFEVTGGSDWVAKPSMVTVKYIGVADKSIEKGVVLSSFNAG